MCLPDSCLKLLILLSTAANCKYTSGLGHHGMGRDGGEIGVPRGRWEARVAIHVCALTEQPVNYELSAEKLSVYQKKRHIWHCSRVDVVLGAFPVSTLPAGTAAVQYLDVVFDQVNG